jgi:DNA invertase Pin-like site-specific DNA recombinase
LKPLAYSYQRFSSAEQRKGDSLRRQQQSLEAFLRRHDLDLDDRLLFVDAGVSGFRGRHRSDTSALGQFLQLVEKGQIARGSYLIVESLDRISREEVNRALSLLLNLIEAGIRVVQLSPTEVIYQAGASATQLIIAIIELSRGNSESEMKSVRGKAAWSAKLTAAREQKKPLTARCPGWLQRVGSGFVVVEDRAVIVRRVFQMAADGYGMFSICSRLTADSVVPFGHYRWNVPTLNRWLRSKAVIGHFQPQLKGKPNGDSIPDYFPRVISDDLFYRVQSGLDERKLYAGRHRTGRPSLFLGLLFAATDGRPLTVKQRGSGSAVYYYRTDHARSDPLSVDFRLEPLERAILETLREIDPAVLATGPGSTVAADIAAAEGQLGDLDRNRERLRERLVGGDGDVDIVVEAIREIDRRRASLQERMASLRQQAAAPDSLGNCQSLIATLEAATDQIEARLRLRSALRRVVERIEVLTAKAGKRTAALVQLTFRNQTYTRLLNVFYRGPIAGWKGSTKVALHYSCSATVQGLVKGRLLSEVAAKGLAILRSQVELANWYSHVEPERGLPADRRRRLKRERYHQKQQRKKRRGK